MLLNTCNYIFISLFLSVGTCVCDENDVLFVILSQSNKYNLDLALNLKHDIINQYGALNNVSPNVLLSHYDLPHIGGWTIFPLIPKLSRLHGNNTKWIFFLEEYTKVIVKRLLITLTKYNPHDDLFVGHALSDRSATIIHHFAFHDKPDSFKYPNIASGFAMSASLLKKLSGIISQGSSDFPDFSIDSSHELALFINQKIPNCVLQHEPALCVKKLKECATFSYHNLCGKVLSTDSLYFAVKTCRQYHRTRVPVIKDTWGKQTSILKFFSHVEDLNVPTIDLGIPNTERGHCEKTLGILKYLSNEIGRNITKADWFVIADDDTILSVQTLSRLLSCYDPTEDIALGERYGYHLISTPSPGFNYITGGGGMIFSRPLVQKIVRICKCPTPHSPDDMYLGACLQNMKVDVVHSPAFHQARPDDYAVEYLQSHHSVSFHKHWMIDPILVYKEWFETADKGFHDEL